MFCTGAAEVWTLQWSTEAWSSPAVKQAWLVAGRVVSVRGLLSQMGKHALCAFSNMSNRHT